MKRTILITFTVAAFILLSTSQIVNAATSSIQMNPNTEIYFQDNGQLRSMDNNHRILFRRSEDKMELREYGDIIFSSGSKSGQETDKLVLKDSGNLGINTNNPQTKLHVKGNSGLINIEGSDHSYIQWYPRGMNGGRRGYMGYATPANNSFYIQNGGNIVLSPDGGMVMVNGSIKTREIVVTTSSPWADYVFDSNYNLKNLEEVESYIKENGHLPNIASAAEIEQNGLSVSEIQTKQMEKIEELTLYAIQMNKENKELKNQLDELTKSVNQLKELVINN